MSNTSNLFNNFDSNHNDLMDRAEFRNFLTTQGINLNDADFEATFRKYDVDNSNQISLAEFQRHVNVSNNAVTTTAPVQYVQTAAPVQYVQAAAPVQYVHAAAPTQVIRRVSHTPVQTVTRVSHTPVTTTQVIHTQAPVVVQRSSIQGRIVTVQSIFQSYAGAKGYLNASDLKRFFAASGNVLTDQDIAIQQKYLGAHNGRVTYAQFQKRISA